MGVIRVVIACALVSCVPETSQAIELRGALIESMDDGWDCGLELSFAFNAFRESAQIVGSSQVYQALEIQNHCSESSGQICNAIMAFNKGLLGQPWDTAKLLVSNFFKTYSNDPRCLQAASDLTCKGGMNSTISALLGIATSASQVYKVQQVQERCSDPFETRCTQAMELSGELAGLTWGEAKELVSDFLRTYTNNPRCDQAALNLV